MIEVTKKNEQCDNEEQMFESDIEIIRPHRSKIGSSNENMFVKELKAKTNKDLSENLCAFCRYSIRLKSNYEAFEIFKRQHLIYTEKLDLHTLFERSFSWYGNKHLVLNELYSRNINAAQNAFKIIIKNANAKTNIFYKENPNGMNVFLNEIKAYNNYMPYSKKRSYLEYLYNQSVTKFEFRIENLNYQSKDLGIITILTKDWKDDLIKEETMAISDILEALKNYIKEIMPVKDQRRVFMISNVNIIPFIKPNVKFDYEQNNETMIISIYDKNEKILTTVQTEISNLIKDFENEVNKPRRALYPFLALKLNMPILIDYDRNIFDNDRYGNELMSFVDYHCKCNLNIDISSGNKIYELKENISKLRQLMPWISIDEDNIDKILVCLYEIHLYLSSSDSKKIMQEIVNDAKRLTVDSTENDVSAFKIKVDKLKGSIDELSIGQISELKEQITKLNEAVSLLYVDDNLIKMYEDNCKYIKERSIYTKDLSVIMDLLLDTINKDKELQKTEQRQPIERIAYEKKAESGTYILFLELDQTSNIGDLMEMRDRLDGKLILNSTKNGVKISLCVTSEDFERLCGIIRNNVNTEYIIGNASKSFIQKYNKCKKYTVSDIKDMLMQISLEDFEKFFIEFDKNAQVELKLKGGKGKSKDRQNASETQKVKGHLEQSIKELSINKDVLNTKPGIKPNQIRLGLLLTSALTPIGENYKYNLKKANISETLLRKILEEINVISSKI